MNPDERQLDYAFGDALPQPGTTLEVSHEEAIHYLRQMAIDDMGRIWRIEENGDMLRVRMVGTLVH